MIMIVTEVPFDVWYDMQVQRLLIVGGVFAVCFAVLGCMWVYYAIKERIAKKGKK